MARINKYNQDVGENIKYLLQQVGMPYVWGGQHTMLTPDNYVSVIDKMESQANNRKAAKEFCEKKFEEGFSVLYGYDCSGLETYYLYNMHHIISADTTADGLMRMCERADEPNRGYWLFRVNEDGKATHIGYMVSDTELVEARGRTYGVVRRRYVKRDWHRIGKPSCMDFDEPKPEPKPTTHEYVKVVGGSVRVREGNGTKYPTIGTAHRGDLLPCYGQDDADPYWYVVELDGESGYISSNERYTKLVQRI